MKLAQSINLIIALLPLLTTPIIGQTFRYPNNKIVKDLHIKNITALCYWTDSLVQEGQYYWEFDVDGNLTFEFFKYNDSTFEHKSFYTYNSSNLVQEIKTIQYYENDSGIHVIGLKYDQNNVLILKYDTSNFNKRTEYFYENDLCILELDFINDKNNFTRSTFNKYNSKNQIVSQIQVLTNPSGGPNINSIADAPLFYKEFKRPTKHRLIESQYAVLRSYKSNAESIIDFEYFYSRNGKLEKIIERSDIVHQIINYDYEFY